MRLNPALLLTVAVSILISLPPANATPATSSDGHFVQHELVHDGRRFRYAVFVPAAAQPRPLPVVLFLHGSGERGSDGQAQTTAVTARNRSSHADSHPLYFPE